LELTPEQKAQFPAFLDRWMAHGLSTQPADRPTAERGVRLAYEAAGLAPPQAFFWAGSPLAGALIDTVISQLSKEGKKKPAPSKTAYPPRILAVVDTVMPLLGEILGKKAPKRAYVIDCLSNLQLHNAAYGQHDASILCFYDFFAQVCGVEECRKLEGLNLVAQSCGWWWAYDTIAILTERPSALSLDDRGRLHADSNWAVLYPDGFGYCLVHGVEVPEHVVLAPEKITIAEIAAEANVEVRRVMIDKYGRDRYIIDSGAVELHRDDWGILYRKEEPDDEPILMVKVVNSTPEPDGSFKDYWIRVAPDCRPMLRPGAQAQELTALNAVASTFGYTGEEYKNLQVQT
jgi:hypothetical protein